MTETTAMMVRTPMMMPSSVRALRSLLARREARAIVNDSWTCSLAIVLSLYSTLVIRISRVFVQLLLNRRACA